MIEGTKVMVQRILGGFSILIMMVVYNKASEYVHTQDITAFNGGSLAATLASIDQNVYMAYFVVLAGIGIAVYQLIYRALQKRRNEFETQQGGWNEMYR